MKRQRPTSRPSRAGTLLPWLLVPCLMLPAACSSDDAPSIVGVWQPSDGSGIKTVQESGACEGMYYSQGAPLDIGGPMTCSMGESANDKGRYTLVVSQPPNTATYTLDFADDDHVTVYQGGSEVVRLSRQ